MWTAIVSSNRKLVWRSRYGDQGRIPRVATGDETRGCAGGSSLLCCQWSTWVSRRWPACRWENAIRTWVARTSWTWTRWSTAIAAAVRCTWRRRRCPRSQRPVPGNTTFEGITAHVSHIILSWRLTLINHVIISHVTHPEQRVREIVRRGGVMSGYGRWRGLHCVSGR